MKHFIMLLACFSITVSAGTFVLIEKGGLTINFNDREVLDQGVSVNQQTTLVYESNVKETKIAYDNWPSKDVVNEELETLNREMWYCESVSKNYLGWAADEEWDLAQRTALSNCKERGGPKSACGIPICELRKISDPVYL